MVGDHLDVLIPVFLGEIIIVEAVVLIVQLIFKTGILKKLFEVFSLHSDRDASRELRIHVETLQSDFYGGDPAVVDRHGIVFKISCQGPEILAALLQRYPCGALRRDELVRFVRADFPSVGDEYTLVWEGYKDACDWSKPHYWQVRAITATGDAVPTIFDREKAVLNQVPMKVWSQLQHEGQADFEGKHYTADMVLGTSRRGLKVTYTTDTRPTENIIHFAKDSDLFICEGMFGEEDKRDRALETCHMLYTEAAQLAVQANVRRLWLTHFSPSMPEPELSLPQAAAFFPSVECGFDGKSIDLVFEEE